MTRPRRARARLGVLVPFTNTNLEQDLRLLCPDQVSFHVARMGGYSADAIPDESEMAALGAADLSEPLRLIEGTKPDLIMFGCTSATLTHGLAFDRELAGRIRASSGAESVTAAGAIVAALGALGITRIGFASPYVGAINDLAIAFLAEVGLTTVGRADFRGTLDNEIQGMLTPDEAVELGLRANTPAAEAVVLSCTDMRSV